MEHVKIPIILISDDAGSISSLIRFGEEFKFSISHDMNYSQEDYYNHPGLIIIDRSSMFYSELVCKAADEWSKRLIILSDKDDNALIDDIRLLKPLGVLIKPLDSLSVCSVIETAGMIIEEINRLKSDLDDAIVRSEEASEAKTRFMATVSHEIRTPMNAIIGMTDLALLTNDSEEILDYLIDLKTASGKLLNLTGKMLDFSKVETGEMKIEPEVFSLKLLVDSAMNRFRQQADEKGLVFTSSISPDIDDCYYGDRGRIRQMLEHIISNAIKFTESGFVRIEIYHSDEKKADIDNVSLIQFNVIDNGIGITPEKQSIIFDKFRQVEDSRTRRWGGTGLGLAISKSLAGLMNGTIGVESIPGQGSRFFFTIPLKVETAIENIKCESSVPVLSDEGFLRILVVEDNPVNAKLAGVILKRLGHIVSFAKNGKVALEMLNGNCYDVIFMDVEMPVMDGIETTIHIRSGSAGEENINIPIVAVTAYALEEYQEECRAAGMDYFLTKPINVMLIPDILSRIKSNCS